MGGGSWDTTSYNSASTARVAAKVDDFDYSAKATTTHTNLDPKRINAKPFGKLESRDSADHPESNAVLICFDVTGSNVDRARVAQQKLPAAMDLLNKYLPDVQVAVAANDDFKTMLREQSVQISDFESDNRIDDHIRSIRLLGNGGGNMMESYDLLLYAAGFKTVLDSVEKRGKKGYLFMYADEPIPATLLATEVKATFNDNIENMPIAQVIDKVKEQYNLFLIWPKGGYIEAKEQYIKLVGEESVLVLQDPALICELIASTVGLFEEHVTTAGAIDDLITVGGLTSAQANSIVSGSLSVIKKDAVFTTNATGKIKSLSTTAESERL